MAAPPAWHPDLVLAILLVSAAVVACAALQDVVLLAMARWGSTASRPPTGEEALPAVTVLVPCFDEERVLLDTLRSVLRSEGVTIDRVVCIDDGSDDATLDVMRAGQRLPGGVDVLVLHQENAGESAALNLGLQEVRTEFFVALDADTQVMPDTVARHSPATIGSAGAMRSSA